MYILYCMFRTKVEICTIHTILPADRGMVVPFCGIIQMPAWGRSLYMYCEGQGVSST